MNKQEHLELAARIWRTRHQHTTGTCSCTVEPDAFAFLADLTPEEFAVYYDASRGVVTVDEVFARIASEEGPR